MLESKFLFVSKILFLAYFIINIPIFFPVKFFDTSYYFIATTTLLDTATLLVLSLSVSKYVYKKNLKLLNNLNIKGENEDEFIKKIETLKKQLFNKSRLSFIIAIFFLLITLIQPIIMVFNLISFFSGFLVSSIIDTSLGEFSEWAIVGSALVVANIESFNNFYYHAINRNKNTLMRKSYIFILLNILNYFKIGVIYGLIVDAFKLGS